MTKDKQRPDRSDSTKSTRPQIEERGQDGGALPDQGDDRMKNTEVSSPRPRRRSWAWNGSGWH